MSEIWFCRGAAGETCGDGTIHSLNAASGDESNHRIDLADRNYNRVETARTIEAGNWQARLKISTASGDPLSIRVTVVRTNSSCVVQQTIIDETIADIPASTSNQAIDTAAVNPGAVAFAAGDILILWVGYNSGAAANILIENDPSASRLEHPEETDEETDTEIRVEFSESSLTGLSLPLTGLQYAVFTQVLMENWLAPALKGDDGIITADREFVLDTAGQLAAETIVAVVLTNIGAAPGPTRGWIGAVEVTEVI